MPLGLRFDRSTSLVVTAADFSCTQALVIQFQTEIVSVQEREFFPTYATFSDVKLLGTPLKVAYQEMVRVPDVVEFNS